MGVFEDLCWINGNDLGWPFHVHRIYVFYRGEKIKV